MSASPYYVPDRAGVVVPVRAGTADGPTKKAARGPRWRRTSQGFYVPASVADNFPGQRITEASVVIPRVGGLTGWAALWWCGALWCDGLAQGGRVRRPVVIAACDEGVRHQCGITISEERLHPSELTFHDGIPVTVPARSVCFEARYATSLSSAVTAFEMAAFADLVTLDEYAAYTLAHPGWTGIAQARAVIELADENSWSPAETRMRLIWVVIAGLPRPACNRPIFDLDGRHIGTPDICDPEHGIVGEYDGRLHLKGVQRARDLRREEAFRRHGLEYFTVLAEDLAEPDRVADRMLELRRRTFPKPTSARAWTLDPPPWWTPTLSVAQRRALAAEGRDWLLPSRRQTAA